MQTYGATFQIGTTISGKHVRHLMRINQATIRSLAAKMDITIKRVRHVRQHGTSNSYITRDWIEAIHGRDPGAY